MAQPGLSSFTGNSEGAARSLSLDILWDEAVRVVPKAMHGCTPVAVKATAGLRLLPGSQRADILNAMEGWIRSYPFQLQEKDGVVIMTARTRGCTRGLQRTTSWGPSRLPRRLIHRRTPSSTLVALLRTSCSNLCSRPRICNSRRGSISMICSSVAGTMCCTNIRIWGMA